MTNKEKFMDLMLDMVAFGVKDGKPCLCQNIACSECSLSRINCRTSIKNWLNEECIEPSIDWSKVPIDTPILVRDYEDRKWSKRHFAGVELGTVFAWSNGLTSWTAEGDKCSWVYAKLAT